MGLLGTLTVSLLISSIYGQEINLHGFSQKGIDNLSAKLGKWAESSPFVSLLAKDGEVLQYEAYGKVNGAPIPKDAIFNLMSMTKPLSGVAMMTFYEEGRFKLDDPVSKHIPQVANMKVDGKVPQKTPMTMAELMSHSAGFPWLIAATGVTLKQGVEDILKGNLISQPGTSWAYGPGVEIQGYLMERWAGKDFNDILYERLLKPLELNDTAFYMTGEKRHRLISSLIPAPTTKPKRIVPSYGLHSTAMDYYKFCQMLLNNGELNGVRILKPESVKLMRTNVLAEGFSMPIFGQGLGFGLDFAVVKGWTLLGLPKESYFWSVLRTHNLSVVANTI
jgi:CubicO group peptidase (beta-lactamase class C family)